MHDFFYKQLKITFWKNWKIGNFSKKFGNWLKFTALTLTNVSRRLKTFTKKLQLSSYG